MKRMLIAVAVAGALVAAAPAVFAADSQSAPTVAAAAEGAPAQRAAPHKRFRLPSERIEARLAYIHTALKITDAQQAQWDNFANVLRKHARDMDRRIEQHRAQGSGARGQRQHVSAVARLERTQQFMQQRAARLGEVIAAAKPLYVALSPEQQQVADQMLSHAGRGRHRGGHHRTHRASHGSA